MKLITVFTAAALVFVCSAIHAQTQQGAWELSASGNFGSVSSSSETTGSFSQKSETDAEGYLSLALRPGYYVIDGLAVEPEFLWTAVDGTPPSFSISGNVAYNFDIPKSQVTPFILAGYGVGNSIPLFQRLFVRSSDDFDISVLNIGAGLKVFLTERIALRTEYRYQRYSRESTLSSGTFSVTTTTVASFHNVFLGFSVFLI